MVGKKQKQKQKQTNKQKNQLGIFKKHLNIKYKTNVITSGFTKELNTK